MTKSNTSLVTKKTLNLLLLFTQYKELSAAEMADLLEVNISSVYRIINTMEETNFIKQKMNKKYELVTATVLQLYNMVSKDLREHARPVIQELSTRFEESVYLSELYSDNKRIVIVEKQDSPKPLKWIEPIGASYDMPVGVAGKTHLTYLLDQLSEDEKKTYLQSLELKKFTRRSVTDIQTLVKDVNQIKKQGFCITEGEHVEGIVGISVPVYNSSTGFSRNTLTMILTETSYDETKLETYVQALKEGANKISRQLI